MSTANSPALWSLEIVHGREPGRVYTVGFGETVVGNDLARNAGINLADQENSSTRRMAGQHAALSCSSREFTIRDLESPGGTFVNRQRLLAGQSRKLAAGDVIQLGGVQIRVTSRSGEPAAAAIPSRSASATRRPPAAAPMSPSRNATDAKRPSAPVEQVAQKPVGPASTMAAAPSADATKAAGPAIAGRLAIAFTMDGGLSCRSWNDFLVLAAQHWTPLRDELTSGRLAEYLRRIGRLDLVPSRESKQSGDDQLDAWLARLPVDQSSAPELDVHPESLTIRTMAGGGSTQQTLRVTNVGYRLLRSTARIEPAETPWLRLRPEHTRSFSTIDQSDLTVELELPESINRPLNATVVIESNGGTRRIAVRVERPAHEELFAGPGPGSSATAIPGTGQRLHELVAPFALGTRLAIACAACFAFRLLILVVNAIATGSRGAFLATRLSSVVFLLVGLGAVFGIWYASRRGEGRDLPAAVLAGGILGLPVAAIGYALIQTAEGLLGSLSNSFWTVELLWMGLGAAAALLSIVLIPQAKNEPETTP